MANVVPGESPRLLQESVSLLNFVVSQSAVLAFVTGASLDGAKRYKIV